MKDIDDLKTSNTLPSAEENGTQTVVKAADKWKYGQYAAIHRENQGIYREYR